LPGIVFARARLTAQPQGGSAPFRGSIEGKEIQGLGRR
jgi:hypothetical protein